MKNKALKVAFSMVVSLSTGFFLFGNAAFAAGEIWNITWSPVSYIGGVNESIPYALIDGTIYSFNYYGTYTFGATPNMSDTIQYKLTYKNVGGTTLSVKDCVSADLSASTWGLGIYPSPNLVHIPLSGTECAIATGQYFSFRAYINGSGAYDPSNLPAFGDTTGHTGTNLDQYLVVNGSPDDFSSRIDTFTYATSTAKATITGYWNATTTPYITERLSFWQYSTSLGKESYEQLTATTTGAFSFTFDFKDPYSWTSGESSTTPLYSSFTLNASLDQYDETNYNFPFGGTVIDNLDATSTTISAAVYNASDFISTLRQLALYPEYECGITSMMGCIKNAAIWLFYPTQDALDSWQSLKGTLETKAPVGYFYQVKNNIGGLSATSTAAFTLTIPAHLKTYIFNPFDIGLSSILWFFFIFHFYKRLKHITI